MEKLFQEDDIQAGELLLSEDRVTNIIFSSGTYQVEVFEGGESYWIFLQFDNQANLVDYFCTCEKGEKDKSCQHLTAAVLAIYRFHKEPLHLRFQQSLWNHLFQATAKRIGYDTSVLEKQSQDCYGYGSFESPFFQLRMKTSEAKNKMVEWIENREEETEETSLKFSNLDPEELEKFRRGRPGHYLRYELSFWSDIAKWFMILEDRGEQPKISFIGEPNQLPKRIQVSMKEVEFTEILPQEIWQEIIPALAKYNTDLKVHEFKDKEIEKITYLEEKGEFSIHAKKLAAGDSREKQQPLGDWVFVPKRGFFPTKVDPILQKDHIPHEHVAAFLTNYANLLEKYGIDIELHKVPREAKYHLYFDPKKQLHICCYLFNHGDLQQKDAHFYNPWVYLPKKGFYQLKGLLFKGAEKIIPKEIIPEFIDRHKNWLSRYEDFRIHLTNLESKLTYKVKNETLSIGGDESLQDKSSDVIDFGPWLYVKGEGFFSKGKDREGTKKVYPGLEIQGGDISNFIHEAKEELEQIKNFFYRDSGLEKTGLIVSLDSSQQIVIEPKYYFRADAKAYEPKIFGDYIYYEGKGFAEIPQSLRIPKKYAMRQVVLPDRTPYFIKHEMPRIKPYLLHLDKRLTEPKKLGLVVKKIIPDGKGWRMNLAYGSNLGEISLAEIYAALLQFAPFILSPAGMILLKDKRFQWVANLDKTMFDMETGALHLSTLDWIKLFLYEDVKFDKTDDPEQQRYLETLRDLRGTHLTALPSLRGLKSKLRPYQEIGVQWLWFLYTQGLPGGFLCDDMGLGKTHQTMALLAAIMNEKKKSQRRKFLVICPTSVTYHWQELLANFLKKARVLFYHGPFRSPKELKKAYDVILTTYGIVRSDKELFAKMSFEVVVLDEIQVAKNERSQIHHTLKGLKAEMKLALTGTPIENHLSELKSLFDITIPGFLPTGQEFKEQFIQPIEKDSDRERGKMLAKLISPFILRRKKQDVLDDLPEKSEEVAYVDLSEEQAKLYDQIARQSQDFINEEGSDFYLHVFALLNKLKQVCNHPALVHKDTKRAESYSSGKWELFTELLSEARRSGQKVVVFTQFLGMLDIIQSYLDRENIGYASIRGSTQARREELKRFRSDPKCEVFIGSLGAAGVGIDLTAASIVIHYDRWWNPAKEDQATDRVHRIGQKRGVMVFKLVTKGTIEEHIHQLIEKKRNLIQKIVGYDSEEDLKRLDREEIVALLKQIQKKSD